MTSTNPIVQPVSTSSAGGTGQKCWCGGTTFSPSAHKSYSICLRCGNAVYNGVLSGGSADAPSPDIEEIYSDAYWEKLQKSRGAPTLESRSRTDLPGRCAYWLRYLLPYISPPAKILELGSSHGGFLKMLAMAGFDVIGMEISQNIVDDANRRFGVNTLKGILENHESNLGKFSAVVMMDVVEHLTDPVRTLSTVTKSLEPDGVLMIQMPEFKPEYPDNWMMFIPGEHTFIHTKASAAKLCETVGLPNVVFEPAIYGNHDQFLFASRKPIQRRTPEAIDADLLTRPDSRMMLALLDATQPIPLQENGTSVRHAAMQLRQALVNFSNRKLLRIKKNT